MKTIIIRSAAATSLFLFLLMGCYKNKEDILELPKVSFRGEIVPIVTAGGCGCHNNGIAARAVQFSHADTIFYETILARSGMFANWVNGGTHPGGGSIDFKPSEKATVQKWIAEGAKDDGGGCIVTGAVTWTKDIEPLYRTTCKGSTCHGGIAINLDYNKMVEKKSTLEAMMASGGASGHPGGPLSLSSCTVKYFTEWIEQGQPK